MQAEAIRKVLTDSRINVSGLVKAINKKGLSRSSLLNKLNDNHPHKLTDDDVDSIKKELLKLSEDLNEFTK